MRRTILFQKDIVAHRHKMRGRWTDSLRDVVDIAIQMVELHSSPHSESRTNGIIQVRVAANAISLVNDNLVKQSEMYLSSLETLLRNMT